MPTQLYQRFINILSLFLVVALLTACVAPSPTAEPETTTNTNTETAPSETATTAPTANLTDGCVETYSPEIDYFPEQVTLTTTDGFTVEYHNNYKLVTVVTPWPGAERARICARPMWYACTGRL
ncbi:MAG: hypothetical protein R2932_53420 [Caldilineaceae bacterium]